MNCLEYVLPAGARRVGNATGPRRQDAGTTPPADADSGAIGKPTKRPMETTEALCEVVPKKVLRLSSCDDRKLQQNAVVATTQPQLTLGVRVLPTQVRHPNWQDTIALAVLLATADSTPALRFPIVRQRIGACLLQPGCQTQYRLCVAVGAAWMLRDWAYDAQQLDAVPMNRWMGVSLDGHNQLIHLSLTRCELTGT